MQRQYGNAPKIAAAMRVDNENMSKSNDWKIIEDIHRKITNIDRDV